MMRFVTLAVMVTLTLTVSTTEAVADVSKEYARKHWSHRGCFVAYEQALVLGDISRDGKSDGVMLWTCGSGAGGAQPRVVTVWIDGEPITRKSLTLPLPHASRISLSGGRVRVSGRDYSGWEVPRCCPDVRVQLTYRWTGKKLALVDEKRFPSE